MWYFIKMKPSSVQKKKQRMLNFSAAHQLAHLAATLVFMKTRAWMSLVRWASTGTNVTLFFSFLEISAIIRIRKDYLKSEVAVNLSRVL